jgi:predicted amidohydrolase YtcJ
MGITATADMGTSADDWLVMRRAGDAGKLDLRIMSYASGIDAMRAVAGTGPTPWLYDGRLRMGGVKIYSDGALGSRGAWLKHDYLDAPGQRGLGFPDRRAAARADGAAAALTCRSRFTRSGDAANAPSCWARSRR